MIAFMNDREPDNSALEAFSENVKASRCSQGYRNGLFSHMMQSFNSTINFYVHKFIRSGRTCDLLSLA